MVRLQAKDDEHPSTALKKLAKVEATKLGHQMTSFHAHENGTFTARCERCFRIASVIPAMVMRDGKGRGGKALKEACTS